MLRLTEDASLTTSKPHTFAIPLDGSAIVDNMFIRVVFPAPLGPRSPNNSPCFIDILTLFTAIIPSKFLVILFVSMAYCIILLFLLFYSHFYSHIILFSFLFSHYFILIFILTFYFLFSKSCWKTST